MQFRYIAIEGNIGAGKSTLAKKLAEETGACLVKEKYNENDLDAFYKNPTETAFNLEMNLLKSRYFELYKLNYQDIDITFSDFSILRSDVFASINLNSTEYKLFKDEFVKLSTQLIKPGILFYISMPTQILEKRINRRARSFEKNITKDYLEKIDCAYRKKIAKCENPLIIINVNDDIDLVNNKDFIGIMMKYLNEYHIKQEVITFNFS